MTFRICFTFGLLTVIYNFYFPTILIVLLAVFNDGAMIALSKVRLRRFSSVKERARNKNDGTPVAAKK